MAKQTKTTRVARKENAELGQRVQRIRKSRGMSQTELGNKIGLSQRAVSHYESGINRIPAPHLLKIAEVLKTSLQELTGKKKIALPETKSKRSIKILQKVEGLPPRKRREVERYIEFIANE